jgi:hypothetical protein
VRESACGNDPFLRGKPITEAPGFQPREDVVVELVLIGRGRKALPFWQYLPQKRRNLPMKSAGGFILIGRLNNCDRSNRSLSIGCTKEAVLSGNIHACVLLRRGRAIHRAGGCHACGVWVKLLLGRSAIPKFGVVGSLDSSLLDPSQRGARGGA